MAQTSDAQGAKNAPGNGAETGTVSALQKAHILAEALPNMLQYDEQTVVVKFGGHAMGDAALSDAFAKDIV